MEHGFQTENARELAYDRIKERILSWELKPGEKISEQELSRQLGVSRTPVREAFMRLAAERLVDIRPQRGTFISRINTRDFRQERFLRLHLELAVMKLAAGSSTPAFERGVRENLEQQAECAQHGDLPGFMELDDAFHRGFYALAGQMLCWGVIQGLEGQCLRVRRFTLLHERDDALLVEQHRAIAACALAGDHAQLEALLVRHTYKLLEDLEKIRKLHGEFFM